MSGKQMRSLRVSSKAIENAMLELARANDNLPVPSMRDQKWAIESILTQLEGIEEEIDMAFEEDDKCTEKPS